jgi:hypothetical protein
VSGEISKTDTTNGARAKMSTSKRPGTPWWRPIVNGIDKRVTPPANNLVRTNLFTDGVAMATRLEVRVRRRLERQSTWLLHQYNLPTAGDIRKMRAQLAAVEARLRDMGERLEDQQLQAQREAQAQRTAQARRDATAKRNAQAQADGEGKAAPTRTRAKTSK